MDALEIIVGSYALIICPPSLYWWMQEEARKGREAKARAEAREKAQAKHYRGSGL